MSPGSYNSTYFGLPASGGSATIQVEGLKESSSVGDQSISGGFGNLRAEVRFTILKGDLKLYFQGGNTEVKEVDEGFSDRTVLPTKGTFDARLSIDLGILPQFALAHPANRGGPRSRRF